MSSASSSLNNLESMLDEMETLRFSDYDRALMLSQMAQVLATKLNVPERLGQALNGAARLYTDRGELDRSTEYLMQSIKLAQRHNLPQVEGWALYLLSTNFQYERDYQSARQLLERQREIANILHDDALYAIMLSDLGHLYFYIHDFQKSIEALLEALTVANPEYWHGALLGVIHLNLVMVYGKVQQQDLMLQHGQESISRCQQANSLDGLATAYIYLANGHLNLRNLEQAQIYLDEAFKLVKQLNIPWLTVSYLESRGNVLAQQGNTEKAFQAFETALNLALQHNLFEFQAQIYTSLIKISQKQGDIKAVCRYQESQLKSSEKANYHNFEKRLEMLKTIFSIKKGNQKEELQLLKSTELPRTSFMAEDTDENRLPTGIRREILSRLTHEFRTPLAIIRTSTDLLSHYYDRMNETQRSAHFERIQDRVIWMTLTLDRILLLLKLRRSEYKILVQAIELQRIIDRTQEEIAGFYGDITRIVWDVQDVALTITIDADLLLEILVQIISNALKFSTEMVRVHLQSHDDKLHIRVIDSGIGIPTDEIKHIKEIFYRANNLDETPGYGIGLAIVEQAIFACKGQWHIASELSVGTQVEIILPLPVLGDDPFQDEELNFS